MKRFIFIVSLLSVVLISCQDKLEEEFNNPNQYNADVNQMPAGLFTKTMYNWKIFVQDYGEWWWQLSGRSVTAYAQVGVVVPVSNYGSRYDNYNDVVNGQGFTDENGIRGYFGDMYKRANAWGVLKDQMNGASQEFLDDNYLYYQLVTMIKDFVLIRNVDWFNSIPYFQAIQGTEGAFFPEYDDPMAIYEAVLPELKTISEELPGQYAKMSGSAQALFAQQDLAFKGDIQKWVQFTNFIRLKYAVRVSGVNEALAKTHIQDVVGKLPTTDLYWALPFSPMADLPGGGTWTRGWYERFTAFFIPDVIMKRMNLGGRAYEEGVDDPRLPVLATPTKFKDYRGIQMNQYAYQPTWDSLANQPTSSKPDGMSDDEWAWKKRFINNVDGSRVDRILSTNYVSCYNYITYVENDFPVYMSSLAEQDLLLAEAAAKNLASTGKTAGAHLQDAVVHSTDFWYAVNAISTYQTENADFDVLRPKKPSQAIVEGYGATVKALYEVQSGIEDQMEIIMQQKYIHLNFMGSYELWTELRRTRHPKLEPITFKEMSMIKPQPERARYDTNEASFNSENYLKVKGEDNYTSPIFWVPEALRSVSYYRDTYIP